MSLLIQACPSAMVKNLEDREAIMDSLKALIPMQSILSDENWKQYQVRFGAVLYIGGIFRLF